MVSQFARNYYSLDGMRSMIGRCESHSITEWFDTYGLQGPESYESGDGIVCGRDLISLVL